MMNAKRTKEFTDYLAAEYWRLVDGMEHGGREGARAGFFAVGTLRLWQEITGNMVADKSEQGELPPKPTNA